MKPMLSENEKEVLKYLVEDGRMQCTEIARRVGISSQAVGKIKSKLEADGVITGYSTNVDFKALGINVFAMALFTLKSGEWGIMEENEIKRRMAGPHIVRAYRLTSGEFTHIVVYGFRSIAEVEHYFRQLQKDKRHISELKRLFIFSADSIMKDTPKDLILKALKELGQEKLASPEVPSESDTKTIEKFSSR